MKAWRDLWEGKGGGLCWSEDVLCCSIVSCKYGRVEGFAQPV